MSFSFSFVAKSKRKKRTKRKRKHATASYALTSVNKMDVAGEPALLRSLKNARDAIVVHLMKIIMDSSANTREFYYLSIY